MLSRKINKILIAESSLGAVNSLRAGVSALAPEAVIRVAMNPSNMQRSLAQWRPVLLVARLQWLFVDDVCILAPEVIRDDDRPSFILALNQADSTQHIVDAVRCGCTAVIDSTSDRQRMCRALLAAVSDSGCRQLQLRRAMAAQLYSEQDEFDLKQMQKDLEEQAFQLAFSITRSKNGISKLLGISRQLVQYHLKKQALSENNRTD